MLALLALALALTDEEITRIKDDGSSEHPVEMRQYLRDRPQLLETDVATRATFGNRPNPNRTCPSTLGSEYV